MSLVGLPGDIVGSRFFPGYGLEPGIRSRFKRLQFPAPTKKFPLSQAGKSRFNLLILLITLGQLEGSG